MKTITVLVSLGHVNYDYILLPKLLTAHLCSFLDFIKVVEVQQFNSVL